MAHGTKKTEQGHWHILGKTSGMLFKQTCMFRFNAQYLAAHAQVGMLAETPPLVAGGHPFLQIYP
jgi:hypothetical protein